MESRLRLCPLLAERGNHAVGKAGNHFNPSLWNILLWHEARWSGMAVVVTLASGYSCCKRSVVQIVIAPQHTLGRNRRFQNTLSLKAYILGERPRSPTATCFWRGGCMSSILARSAEGMAVWCIALFAVLFLCSSISTYDWRNWSSGNRPWSILIRECSPLPPGYFRFKVLYLGLIFILRASIVLLELKICCRRLLLPFNFFLGGLFLSFKHRIGMFLLDLYYGVRILKNVLCVGYRGYDANNRAKQGTDNSNVGNRNNANRPEYSNNRNGDEYGQDRVNEDQLGSEHIILANVRDDRSPLAFGADPAAAGCVTKVPKAW